MRLYLLDDGKLCFTSADSLDDDANADADAEDSEESVDWTIKVFFDKLKVE